MISDIENFQLKLNCNDIIMPIQLRVILLVKHELLNYRAFTARTHEWYLHYTTHTWAYAIHSICLLGLIVYAAATLGQGRRPSPAWTAPKLSHYTRDAMITVTISYLHKAIARNCFCIPTFKSKRLVEPTEESKRANTRTSNFRKSLYKWIVRIR